MGRAGRVDSQALGIANVCQVAEELQAVQAALGLPALKMMRTGEKLFKELGLHKDSPEAELLAAMGAHPILIERPIAIKADKAVIGRPTEALEALI